ncbi:uncharacterized protein LOC62_05G007295 [Vanrija pseudolonga]|uniref:F-box domain-containing protein n=1 Tax=Vanrija pseudolonga TaxID=143232 RepID=A0AAF1BKA8_9TREE|nr:hypothetical protein LOC62_05G007295 [Vanrija pseudolonga]
MCDPAPDRLPATLGALGKLPTELFLQVAALLDIQSRARLLRLNSAFYSLAAASAYSNLLLFTTQPLGAPLTLPLQGCAAVHAEHVRVIDVFTHPQHTCRTVKSTRLDDDISVSHFLGHDLPNLRTLHLHIDDRYLHSSDDSSNFTCWAIQYLCPPVVVVHSRMFHGSEISFASPPPEPPEGSVQEERDLVGERLVCVLEEGWRRNIWSNVEECLISMVGERTTSATFVLRAPVVRGRVLGLCGEAAKGGGVPDIYDAFDLYDAVELDATPVELDSSFLAEMVGYIGHHEPLDHCSVTIVNAGWVGPGQADEETANRLEIERSFREAVNKRCCEIGLDAEATARRQEMIRFITMREYLAEPGVLDVFHPTEIAEWLRQG